MIASPFPPAASARRPNARAAVSPLDNILLMTRETSRQQQLSAYLNKDFSLFPARNGRDLTKTLETRSIRLIIIDIGTHPGDDIQLCTQLKASPDYNYIPVLLLLPAGSSRLRIKYLQSGADALLEKPFSQTCLKAQIANLVANRARIKNFFVHSYPGKTPAPSEPDCTFSKKLDALITDNLSNPSLDVNLLAKLMNMSRPTFYRKVRSISNSSPNDMIGAARLKKAAALIASSDQTMSEIAALAGFHSRSSFGRSFFNHFHLTPTEYRTKNRPAACS